MYKIIGIDGRQYGPVSAGQIKEWIAAGRANALSQIQAEGTQDWKPLSEFPEFAESLAGKMIDRAAEIASATPSSEAKSSIDAGSCLGRAWDKLMSDLWPTIGVSALVWLLLSASHTFWVGLIVTGPLLGGLSFYYLKKIRGQPAELQDAFAGFTMAFPQLLLTSLLSGLLITLGLALCVIPGIYLAVAWSFALPLVIDKQMGSWQAMELNRQAIYPRWWSMAWLLLICGLINFGGGLLCCVGIFFTLPLTGLAMMYAYEDVFGTQPAKGA